MQVFFLRYDSRKSRFVLVTDGMFWYNGTGTEVY